MLVWIVGSGGLLGSAVARLARRSATVFAGQQIPWGDASAVDTTLRTDARRFAAEAGAGEWAVVWAAGASVVASSEADTSVELGSLTTLVTALGVEPPSGAGACFVTSSAGGLYAGSSGPPFDADSPPRPISPYGRLKLAQEEAARTALAGRVPLVIGRIANLYGPDQDPAKGQGLIPLLCRAAVRRTPLNLYVSMDTVRDYLYVDDAARLVWQCTVDAVRDQPAEPRIVVLASGQAATVAEVVATVQNVAHRRVPLALGTDPSARHQATDLRLVPTVVAADLTPLPNGIKRVLDATVGRTA